MKISPQTAALSLHGLQLSGGIAIENLRDLDECVLQKPVFSNGDFQTCRLSDPEAASHLVFKNGKLWQVQIALIIQRDEQGQVSELGEKERHLLHEKVLVREIGATKMLCENGSRIELCFDDRSLSSVIIVTYPQP